MTTQHIDHAADSAKVHDAVSILQDKIHSARIVGQLKDGKLEIDEDQIKKLAEIQPNAVFLALNSPFDPNSICPATLA